MRTVFLHGLGQNPKDWEYIIRLVSGNSECPELFSYQGNDITYSSILQSVESRYANASEPFRICGISLGGMLAMDYAIRHIDQISSLVLIGVQYKVPRLLLDFQNVLFHLLPNNAFANTGLSKHQMLKLTHSMRCLDFSDNLNKITCPVTIVCGKNDKANLKAAKSLNRLLPQSTLKIISQAGHEVNKDAPGALSDILNLC